MTPTSYPIRSPATRPWRVALALIAGAVAFWLVWAITAPPGPGLTVDSASYVSASESLARAGTLRVPAIYRWASPDSAAALAHFPPGFPAALAIPRALDVPEPVAARLVAAGAALVTAAASFLMVAGASGAIAGAIAVLVVFATPAIIETHLSLLSEPLFYALVVLTLASMARFPDRPLRSGVAAAAGSLVRYAGVSLVGGVVLWAIARGAGARDRVRRAALAALPALVAQGAWLARTRYQTGGGVRHIGIYGGFAATVRQGVATIEGWLAPGLGGGAWRVAVALAALVLVAALIASAMRQLAPREPDERRGPEAGAGEEREQAPARRLLAAALLLAAVYAAVVVLARLFADGLIPFDDRILSPLFLPLEIAAVVALAVWWRSHTRAAHLLAAAALLLWCGASLVVCRNEVHRALTDGAGYATARWRTSPLVAWARGDGARCVLFTNHPAAFYFHAHRFAHGMPLDQRPAVLRAFAHTVAARGGVLVAFDVRSDEFAIPPDTVLRALSFRRAARMGDGALWVPAAARARAGCEAAPAMAKSSAAARP